MKHPGFFELMGFGPQGWGYALLGAALMTLIVTISSFLLGSIIGVFGAWAKVSGSRMSRLGADGYTTVLRGIPDILVIYLFYFGGSSALSALGKYFGTNGFINFPGILAGALAIGVVSGAHQTEVFRGAFNVVHKGELEAARACGMNRILRFRRVIAPLTIRLALPALGNVWQTALKGSALVSITGASEIMRQAALGAGATGKPFSFYSAALILYLIISSLSGWGFSLAETRFSKGIRRN